MKKIILAVLLTGSIFVTGCATKTGCTTKPCSTKPCTTKPSCARVTEPVSPVIQQAKTDLQSVECEADARALELKVRLECLRICQDIQKRCI